MKKIKEAIKGLVRDQKHYKCDKCQTVSHEELSLMTASNARAIEWAKAGYYIHYYSAVHFNVRVNEPFISAYLEDQYLCAECTKGLTRCICGCGFDLNGETKAKIDADVKALHKEVAKEMKRIEKEAKKAKKEAK